MTTVYLIRHAEAEGNIYRRCHGQYNSLLTSRGEEQAEHLAQRFRDIHIDAVYASDLYRAEHTALAIAESKGLTVEKREALREINMGEWEDRTWAELPMFYPEHAHLWSAEPWKCHVPKGESIMEAGQRVYDELVNIVKENRGKTIAVVSHGTAIRGVLCITMGLPPEQMMEVGWGDNTCVAKFDFEDDGTAQVEYKNDVTHLPEELSTFALLKWRKGENVPSSAQMWFKPVDFNKEEDILIHFAKQVYEAAYGDEALLNAENFLEESYQMAQKNPRAVTFGMIDGIAGALVRMNVLDESVPNTGIVGSFCIEKKYRGFGFSPQILGQAISVYREMGKDYLAARVAARNERAQGFYKKNGFENMGEWYNELGKHFIMRKDIRVR